MSWKPSDEYASEYGLVMPFIDESPEFCLGFEVGQIYGRMEHGPSRPFTQTVHTENAGQLRLVGTTLHWSVQLEPLDENWSTFHATPDWKST